MKTPLSAARLLGVAVVAFAILFLFFSVDESTNFEKQTIKREPLSTEMGESTIVIRDLLLTARLVGGKAAFAIDSTEPDGEKGQIVLGPVVAKSDGDLRKTESGHDYVFGTVRITFSNKRVLNYLLMYEDDGKKLLFITAAPMRGNIAISSFEISPRREDLGGDFRVRVQIFEKVFNEATTSETTVRKIVTFRIKKDYDTLTQEGEDGVNPNVPEPERNE